MTIVPQNFPESPEQLKIIIAQQRLQIQEYKRTQTEGALQKKHTALQKKLEKKYNAEIKKRDKQIKARDTEIDILREALRLRRIELFGAHSEKLPSNQSELFNEAEVFAVADKEENTADIVEVPAHTRVRGKRKPLPDHLPREDKIIDLPEDKKICERDGSTLNEIGREVSEKLDVIPAQFKVIRTIRIMYGCACCEKEGTSNIKTAPLPETILPKSNATAGLLAYIATSKYVDALPLYRLEQIFARYAVEIPRNTMARWMIELHQRLIPLYNLMADDLLASDYICCDETRVQVLNEDGKAAQTQSYMWVRTRHGPGINPIILFDYDPSRSGSVPSLLLAGFHGYLQVDGYAGYNDVCKIEGVTRIGCMAHVRRKFFDVHKASKKQGGSANMILQLIKKLYKIEDEIKEKTIDERFETRLEKEKPILEKIKEWLDANQSTYPPTGLMGKAITYATNQWEYVINYLKDGRLDIDNNFTENRIRPFAIGRKNWLFSDSVAGAKASAMIYSILQTARANGLEPYAYMRYLLTELPKCQSPEQIETLLPHKIDPKVLY